ncbi:MAG TPA: hypothetical protein VMU39_13655 [Solirubrobacteraceae bacterium]|nr:hypothetical protein [Solirubrobacteraceae bacterium]
MWAKLFKTSTRSVEPRATFAEEISDRDGHVCRYLTDGVNLYRFMGSMVSRAGEMVGIENCRSLDIMLVPAEELHRRRVRPVSLAGID